MIGDGGKIRQRTTPILSQRIEIGGFCNSDDLAVVLLVGPTDRAIGTAEGAEVKRNSNPEFGVLGCRDGESIAGNPADPQLVREMEKGQKLSIQVVDSSVQSITTEIPLSQFAAVRKGAPVQTFQQDIDE